MYVHSGRALNHQWLRRCDGFKSLTEGPLAENLGEIALLRALHRSPYRVHHPVNATLIYVPIFEFTSTMLPRRCEGTTHASRMRDAHTALISSPSWQQSHGERHMFASTAYSSKTVNSLLADRLEPLTSNLLMGIVGRYKTGFPWESRVVRDPRCVVALPYPLPLAVGHAVARLWPTTQAPTSGPRPRVLFFAGSLDVCCTGRETRCAIGELMAHTQGAADVLIRATGKGPCTRKARNKIARSDTGRGLSEGAGSSSLPPPFSADSRYKFVNSSLVEQMASEMASTTFCLVPPGDTCITSRLYWAIALGCLPVVLCDDLSGAMAELVPYRTFWIKPLARSFIEDPPKLLQMLRAMPSAEIVQRQEAMIAHRADVLYDHPHSRLGTNFLRMAGRTECGRPALPLA